MSVRELAEAASVSSSAPSSGPPTEVFAPVPVVPEPVPVPPVAPVPVGPATAPAPEDERATAPTSSRLRPKPFVRSSTQVTPFFASRRRSESPRKYAKTKQTSSPAASAGTMGAKISFASICSAEEALAVGPPHGTMLRVPLMRPATQVRTTGDISRRW